jgi:hypothetical protein
VAIVGDRHADEICAGAPTPRAPAVARVECIEEVVV